MQNKFYYMAIKYLHSHILSFNLKLFNPMANYESILDSNSKLLNLKNRFGLRACGKSSTSIYLAQKKLQKFLHIQLKSKIEVDWQRGMLIDKIVDRCEDLETINCVMDLFIDQGVDSFILLASGQIRPFFKSVYAYSA